MILKEGRFICRYIYNLSIAILAILGMMVILSCDQQNNELQLIVVDPRCETVYHEFEVETETVFSLIYRHSVSGSLVRGTFLINDQNKLEPLTTEFKSYGPGLPLDRWESYEIKNGMVTIYHDEEPREAIRLWVSSYTEETLIINELEIPLYKPEINHLLIEIRVVNTIYQGF